MEDHICARPHFSAIGFWRRTGSRWASEEEKDRKNKDNERQWNTKKKKEERRNTGVWRQRKVTRQITDAENRESDGEVWDEWQEHILHSYRGKEQRGVFKGRTVAFQQGERPASGARMPLFHCTQEEAKNKRRRRNKEGEGRGGKKTVLLTTRTCGEENGRNEALYQARTAASSARVRCCHVEIRRRGRWRRRRARKKERKRGREE